MPVTMGWTTKLRPEKASEYLALHANPWPEILALLKAANIADYTIWYYEPEHLLFSSFVYRGSDFHADMAMIAADPVADRWHKLTAECQIAMGTSGAPWAALASIFRME